MQIKTLSYYLFSVKGFEICLKIGIKLSKVKYHEG